MTLPKTLGLNLVLIGLLSACGSTPFVEQSTGVNLLETNQPIYTLVNLHPDPNNNRMYSVNYQLAGFIPRCTKVHIQAFNGKVLTFNDAVDEQVYTLIKHGSPPDFPRYLNKYFGTDCDNEKVNTLSAIDQKGTEKGEALIGMSKDGVVLAIGYPPEHKTPSLNNNRWMYWFNRWNRFAVEFDSNGLVSNIQD